MDNDKILGYFIEEAKEHLMTVQQGLLDLKEVMADEERVSELFRAAHSIKGGSAMLGYTTIQKTAHKLEDCFKVLRDNPIPVDRKLEELFVEVYEVLNELIDKLQGPYGLSEEEGNKLAQKAEPHFQLLVSYLNELLAKIGAPPMEVHATPVVATTTPTKSKPPQETTKEGKATAPDAQFFTQTTDILKQMLTVFKQKETPANRQQLTELCTKLNQLNNNKNWQSLLQISQKAIGNKQNNYLTLAPLIIKEVKYATDLLSLGKENEIAVSNNLQQLATPPASNTSQEITIPVDPLGAAKILVKSFNKQQVLQLSQFLQKALQQPAKKG